MTSKEKLQELKEQIQEEMAEHWQGYKRQEYETHKYDKDFDSIIKYLEILDVIKNCRMLQIGLIDNKAIFTPMYNKYDDKKDEKAYTIFLTDEEFELIKEVRKK